MLKAAKFLSGPLGALLNAEAVKELKEDVEAGMANEEFEAKGA